MDELLYRSFTLRSGQISSGYLANNSVVSGSIASGQIGTNALSSGTIATATNYLLPGTFPTQELISGIRTVAISPSGNVWIAMASVSGRNPAIGIVIDNVLSGQNANIYTAGKFQLLSGMVDFTNSVGQLIYVGRSGQLCPVSGSWNSGGFSNSDNIQGIGIAFNSGGIFVT